MGGGKLSRREVIAGVGASAMALSKPGFGSPAPIARGVVFEDVRGDGRRQPGDPGIPNVMVSNGREVVLTALDGSWSLHVEPGDSIFVIKPPDWACPALPGGIPKFSYLYQPDGSPAYLSSGFPLVEPTRALPHSLDFPLVRRMEPRDFQVVLMADTQPQNADELEFVRDDIIGAMLGVRAAFGINHGDVVADDLSLYERYLQILGSTGIPWHHCPGNHDINYDAKDDVFSRETWKRVFGARHYAFQHGNATFLLLDNVEYLGRESRCYRGWLGQRQLDFVRNVLEHVPRDHLVVCSMHIPLQCHLGAGNPADTTGDYRALLQILANRPHTVSFAGHLHATEHHYLQHETSFSGPHLHHHHILTAACGSWWSGSPDHRGIPSADSPDGTPNGFHVLSVSQNRYATRFVPAAAKPATQLRVVLDGPHRRRSAGTRAPANAALGFSVPETGLGECRIVVNVFDGGPRTRVSYEVLGQSPVETMQMAPIPDPLIHDLYAGESPRKSWVQAVASTHIWQAPLKTGLPPGSHALIVRALDEYGQEHIARAIIEVIPRSRLL